MKGRRYVIRNSKDNSYWGFFHRSWFENILSASWYENLELAEYEIDNDQEFKEGIFEIVKIYV